MSKNSDLVDSRPHRSRELSRSNSCSAHYDDALQPVHSGPCIAELRQRCIEAGLSQPDGWITQATDRTQLQQMLLLQDHRSQAHQLEQVTPSSRRVSESLSPAAAVHPHRRHQPERAAAEGADRDSNEDAPDGKTLVFTAKVLGAVAAIVALSAGVAMAMHFFGVSFKGADGAKSFYATWLVLSGAGLVFTLVFCSMSYACMRCCKSCTETKKAATEDVKGEVTPASKRLYSSTTRKLDELKMELAKLPLKDLRARATLEGVDRGKVQEIIQNAHHIHPEDDIISLIVTAKTDELRGYEDDPNYIRREWDDPCAEEARADAYFEKLYNGQMALEAEETARLKREASHNWWERLYGLVLILCDRAAKVLGIVVAIVVLSAGVAVAMHFFGVSFQGTDGARSTSATWLVLSGAGLVFSLFMYSISYACMSCCNSCNPGQEEDSIRGPDANTYLGCVDGPLLCVYFHVKRADRLS